MTTHQDFEYHPYQDEQGDGGEMLGTMGLQALYDKAVQLAHENDYSGFQKLILGIDGRRDQSHVEDTLCKALLENDAVDMFQRSFEMGRLAQWCLDNTPYVVRHCPNVLYAWVMGGHTRLSTVYGAIANELATMPEASRVHLLRGTSDVDSGGYSNTKAHMLLHKYLADGAYHWYYMPPHWLGAPGSELRQAALDLKWEPKYLPQMVHQYIEYESASAWRPNVPFPYSLMACHAYQRVQNWGSHVATGPISMQCDPTSTALDIALAKAVLAQCGDTCKVRLRRPRSIAPLSKTMEQQVLGFVQAHVALGTMDSLALSLAHGNAPLFTPEASLALPEDLGFGGGFGE